MNLQVYIPSLNRADLLTKCANSILEQGVPVILAPNRQTSPRPLIDLVNEGCAAALQANVDACLFLADHVTLEPGCLEALVNLAALHHPFTDYMFGLNIVNLPPAKGVREYCFFMLGRDFMRRFPNGKIFCPDYYHFFGDTELGDYATSIEKFTFVEQAGLKIHHPNAANRQVDYTHMASRIHYDYEKTARKRRKLKNFLWGKTFELLGDRKPWR